MTICFHNTSSSQAGTVNISTFFNTTQVLKSIMSLIQKKSRKYPLLHLIQNLNI